MSTGPKRDVSSPGSGVLTGDRMSTDRLFTKYYYSRPAFVDGTAEFHHFCCRFIRAGTSILEIGSGPGNKTSEFLASLGSIVGVDVSSEIHANRWLTGARVYDGRRLPFEDNSFSVCVSNYVLEHVTAPLEHFQEVRRILRPGGVYCCRTPNLLHYVTLFSRLTPHHLHVRLANRLRCLAGNAHDPYATFYKANTRARIRELSSEAGLFVLVLRTIEKEPSYGRASALLFYPMMLYERAVNSSVVFSGLRANILAALQKPAE